MVDRNEYKRRQAAPGLRVSGKAFGIGRRLPIVMRWNRDDLKRLTVER
jgi:NAD+ synthase (glutamine-hydrolysing)